MTDIAVHLQNISKQYHIGKKIEKYETLRDKVADAFIAPFRRTRKLLSGQATGASELDETIWALEDISFDIEHGESVAIIGRNGAGKSTLLKVLSRITEPTTGYAEIRGRVSSLLEVGTGFHPELTGRENVYLNGAILGMRRIELDHKFDEMVAFAEVEKFVDTPVKHYSSGMQLRLAFAVAAHLEPEILIVDEVLAVGDAAFQRKCINKMQEVGKQGQTILFVSHNMQAVTRLCNRGILLQEGRVIADGPTQDVIHAYMEAGVETAASQEWPDPATAPGGEIARLRAVRVCNEHGQVSDMFDVRSPIFIEMEYEVLQGDFPLMPHFHLYNEEGMHLFATIDQDPAWRRRRRPAGHYVSRVKIPGNFMTDGRFYVHCNMLVLNPRSRQFVCHDVVAFRVMDNIGDGTARGDWTETMGGVVRPLLQWSTEFSLNGHKVTVPVLAGEQQ
jgi:lipopolysaccharide transport system ATP-binding protein